MFPCLASTDIIILYATGLISTCCFFITSKVSKALTPYSKSQYVFNATLINYAMKLTLPAFNKKRSLFSYNLGPCIFHCLNVIGVFKERGLNLSSVSSASVSCCFQVLAHLSVHKLLNRETIEPLRAIVLPNAQIML